MFQNLAAWVGAIMLLLASTSSAQADDANYEAPPLLDANTALPGVELETPVYTIDRRVVNDGFLNTYLVRSKYGDFRTRGTRLLLERLKEIHALSELERVSTPKTVIKAAERGTKDVLLAPVKLVADGIDLVSHPEKIQSTIEEVPTGVSRMFTWAGKALEKGADSAADLFSDDEDPSGTTSAEEDSHESEGTLALAQRGAERGEELTLRYIGYRKNERRLYETFDIDPSTKNELLRSEIRRVATVETSVGLGFKFVPGLPSISQLQEILKWKSNVEQVAYFKDPIRLQSDFDKLMEELEVSRTVRERFSGNKRISSTAKGLLIDRLRSLEGVENRGLFVDSMSRVQSEEGAVYFLESLRQLVDVHRAGPLRAIVPTLRIPAAVTKDGRLIAPVPVDYLVWSKPVADVFREFKSRVSKNYPFKSAEIRLNGKVSKRCKRELERLGAKVA